MINFIKKRWKKITLIILAFIMALSLPITTFAEDIDDMHEYIPPAGNIKSVQDILRDEAHAQLAIYVLSECIGGGVNRNESWDNVIDHTKWFNRAGLRGDLNIATGYWYERLMQGEPKDGQIKCSDKGTSPVNIAADLIGVDPMEIYCNGTSAGIAMNKDFTCGSSSGKYTRNGNSDEAGKDGGDGSITIPRRGDDGAGIFNNQPWSKHLESLYNKKAEEEKWERRYEEADRFDSMVGYYLYRTEIEIGCGGFDKEFDSEPSDMDMVLKDVTQDVEQAGKVVYRHYTSNNTFKHEFVNNEHVGSCSAMINRANQVYPNYRNRLIATLNNECRNNIEDRIKEAEASGIKLSKDTIKKYNEAKENTDNYNIGQFVEGNEEIGWKCADIGDLEGATQSDPTGDDIDDVKTDPDCYTNAGSLGWILCPIINQGSDFVTMIYEKMIEPFLVLDSGLFNRNDVGGKATYDAWTQFQSYANIAFIAVFLVVIFSQLTGYGIDNYGIKKILPKLIVAALLINLSYIICQLAVDIANVAGYGVKGILDNIGKVDFASMSTAEAPGAKPVVATGILVGLVALLSAPALLSLNVAILVPVFMAIVGIVIAIFTLFCILAVRKAFAVILVVISPMAFVCYMLPNTKKLFDKWFTAFKAVLIAFPICSAMVYGGQAVARILIQASGGTNMPFLIVLSAAVMCIAPVFLIPGTLKKSMGAIAGAIDRVSRGARHSARGRIANSGVARDLQRRGQMQRAGVKLGKDGQVHITGRGKMQEHLPRTRASKQRLAAMREDAVKSMSAAAAAENYMGARGEDRMNAMYSSSRVSQDKQRVSDLEASYKLGNEGVNVTDVSEGGQLQTALQNAIISGDTDRVKALSNIATSQGDKGRTAIKNAIKGAESAAGTNGVDNKKLAAGKQALAANIMDNYAGSYKENARSTYDWAAKNQANADFANDKDAVDTINSQANSMAQAEASVSSGSLRGSHMNNMDDADFDNMKAKKEQYEATVASGGTLTSDQKTDYQNIVAAATAGKQDQSFTATKVERQRAVESMSNTNSDVIWNNVNNQEKDRFTRNNPQRAGESNAEYGARMKKMLAEEIAKKLK